MLPTINGKSFLECSEEDLKELIDNPDYRENEYVDYKETFAFLDMPKNNPERIKHIAEFRSDVCAFANSEGGYLVYGISDDKGMAKSIEGIEIKDSNTDKFELDRKNNLNSILPKIPSVQFKFIPLANGKYVIVIHIKKDAFSPYIHIENETNYKIYKRIGNGKSSVGYVELKNMFNQSLSIENEVQNYRKQRIDYYRSQEDTEDYRYSKFLLLHIIPDTFTDSSYRKNVFLLQKQQPTLKFSQIFDGISCNNSAQPNVDGLRYMDYRNENQGTINNNGIAECFCPIHNLLKMDPQVSKDYLPSAYLWGLLEPVIRQYVDIMKNVLSTKRLFLGISVLGCKDVMSEINFDTVTIGHIDRNTIICPPTAIENYSNEDEFETSLKWLQIEYYLSLGIKTSKSLTSLIEEVTKNANN